MSATRQDENAKMAAVEFEPWKPQADGWVPPTNTEWSSLADPHLLTIRLAYASMFRTKAEMAEALGVNSAELGFDMLDRLRVTIDYFEGLLTLLKTSECRTFIALAQAAEDETKQGAST